MAKPQLSATSSRSTDSGVGRAAATSPTTSPKSKLSSAANLRASSCIRRLLARQAMCRVLMPRLRAASSVRSSSAEPTPWLCQSASMLSAASASRAKARPSGRNSAAPRSTPSAKKPCTTEPSPNVVVT